MILRLFLVGIIAGFALSRPALANSPCTTAGTTQTCTGDQSTGVANPPAGISILDVNNLNQAIAPTAGMAAIFFRSSTGGDVTINSDTGSFGITTNGIQGIVAVSQGNGNTGAVTVNNTGNISTIGTAAIEAESLPNLNGNAGPVTVNNTGNITARVGITAETFTNGGGFAGAITVVNVGNIVTTSDAIFARAEASSGDAGGVTVTNTGNITANFFGIAAESISTLGHTGQVTVTTSGDITVESAASQGIQAASEGPSSTSGNSTVNVLAGTVTVTGINSAAVQFRAGATDTLNNAGTLQALDPSSYAVQTVGTHGSAIVNNAGTVSGNVDLGAGADAFNNLSGATFNSGATIKLNGGTLTNAGTFALGGTGAITSASLTGNFIQKPAGTYTVDLDLAGGTADRTTVSGTAVLGGTVLATADTLKLGSQSFTILTSGGTTNDQLALTASPVLRAQLSLQGNDVVVTTNPDFVTSGLNSNQTAIADHLDGSLAAGGGGLDPVLLALANTPGLSAYRSALDQLSPEVYLDTEIATLFSSLNFANSLLSCRTRDGAYAIINEGQCVWAQVQGDFLNRSATVQNFGFQDDRVNVAGGAQIELAPFWHLGLAGSYQHDDLEAGSNASSRGDSGFGGAALKYNWGPVLLAASVSGGGGTFDTKRMITIPGVAGQAEASDDVTYVAGGFRAAYLADAGNWYLKPLVDVNVTHLDLGDAHEHGAGAASLDVDGEDKTVWTFSPALEVGSQLHLSNDTLVRPYIRGGATVFSDTDFGLLASFDGTPAGVAPFAIDSKIDRVLGVVSVGVDAFTAGGATLKLSYDGHYGETISDSSVTGRASFRF